MYYMSNSYKKEEAKSSDSICIICPNFVLFSIRLPSMVQFQHKAQFNRNHADLDTDLPLNKLLD